MKNLYVINSLGEKEDFSLDKVYKACRNAGLTGFSGQKIVEAIKKEIYPGITTAKLFEKVRRLVKRESAKSAIKFSLKNAMRRLGPAGFFFEKYIGEIFVRNGYNVKLNQYLFGRSGCQYEIDFLAEKGNLVYVGECKYRNISGERIALPVALANHARFLDISKNPDFKKKKAESILVTNTKFTSEAIKYSEYAGVNLLGWKYPGGRGLERFIEKENLYPITILPSFKGYLTEIFAQKKMILALNLIENPTDRLCRMLKVGRKEIQALVDEAKILLE